MATLVRTSTGERYKLTSEHLVGRSRTCALRLTNELASRTHATFHWVNDGWELRDLGTANGTFVNDRRLPTGGEARLRAGARIAFGDAQDIYELVDDAPPEAMVHCPDGSIRHGEDGHLALPSADKPSLWIEREDLGRWSIETEDGERREAADDELIELDGACWRLELPTVLARTQRPGTTASRGIEEIGLRFTVSADEEFVDIDIVTSAGVDRLSTRAHHYVLLTLARKRLSDQGRPSLSQGEHGWFDINDLLRLLKIGRAQLDLDIHRARRQFREEGRVSDSARLIERRRGAKVRIGVEQLQIFH